METSKILQFFRKFTPIQWAMQSTQAVVEKYSSLEQETMCAWQFNSYGDESKLRFCRDVPIPLVKNSNHVLVKVEAASINPIDLLMASGTGSVLLNNMRKLSSFYQDKTPDLPLTLGRDFAGVVVAKGSAVKKVNVGDEVYGVVPPKNQGSHSQYTVTEDNLVVKKPQFLSTEEACGILYAGITAWCVLKAGLGLSSDKCKTRVYVVPSTGESISVSDAEGKRVLVIGSSGGVGTSAVQLLNAWGAEVVAVCSKDGAAVVTGLQPTHIVDYTEEGYMNSVEAFGPYDLVLDAAGLGESRVHAYIPYLKSCGSIITLTSPLLENVDRYGLIGGAFKSIVDLAIPNVTSGVLKKGGLIKWGFFTPSESAVQEIEKLVLAEKMVSIIERKYNFSEVPQAFERMKRGHVHGKLVISMRE